MSSSSAPAADGERRRFVVAGALFLGILVVLIALVAVLAGGSGDERRTTDTTVACAEDDTACRIAQQGAERPSIIPEPGEGRAPDDPGEPGGWAQVALFGLIVAALAVIVALVVRSTRRAAGRRTPDPDASAVSR
ncbi:hypothetical protein HC251_00880 [Iamia sp. SCSIO 61187]|uniref:hypothetical protein n=1 Tax=Iamia sp. SCSIO 61187 TaxID=2722752 RepID=UPI001C62EE91|nr:hypothetical protein [Iamia sp. SCSIO 61187]QYG91127.1 hypothetical protein HC251_00880 [Iamia sp. SCSIO 61187]